MMKNKKGFTLIELLVVVLIIGILAAVAVPQYNKAVLKSRYLQAVTLVEKINLAQQLYYLENNKYTALFDELDIDMPTPISTANGRYFYYSWGHCWQNGLPYAGCYINLGPSSGVAYVAYPAWGWRYCWAKPADDTHANAFCQAMTKKQTGNKSGVWKQYSY